MYKFSVNVEGEYYKRVGKGEKDNIEYALTGMKVEAVSEEMLPPAVRDEALHEIRRKVDRKASAIRLFTITKITRLGKVKDKKPVEAKDITDMTMAELREFAEDNKIRIPHGTTTRAAYLDVIENWNGDRDDGAISGRARDTFKGETGDFEEETEETEDEESDDTEEETEDDQTEDGDDESEEELDDRGQPTGK